MLSSLLLIPEKPGGGGGGCGCGGAEGLCRPLMSPPYPQPRPPPPPPPSLPLCPVTLVTPAVMPTSDLPLPNAPFLGILMMVKEGHLLNDVGNSMSGFASKLSAAGTKGWKDLQSLWGEPKTTLTSADTSPGEKSSLLGRSSYGSGDDSSKSHLLGDEDESWGDWGQDSDWSSSSKKPSKKNSSDWSAGNEDDLEAWLNDDDTSGLSPAAKSKNKKKNDDDWNSWKTDSSSKTSAKSSSSSSSLSSKSKKKSQKSSTAVSSSDGWDDADWNSGLSGTSSKQKQPLVGNLLDLGEEEGSSAGSRSRGGDNDGWDNEVWAQDDDDEWQTLDLGTDVKKAS